LEAVDTEKFIINEREKYRLVAAEGALLYFIIKSLNNLSHMYQYSLESFLIYFNKAMEETTLQGDGRIL
jgi:dynein heavy chain